MTDIGLAAFQLIVAVVFVILVQQARIQYRAKKARDKRRAEWLRKAKPNRN